MHLLVSGSSRHSPAFGKRDVRASPLSRPADPTGHAPTRSAIAGQLRVYELDHLGVGVGTVGLAGYIWRLFMPMCSYALVEGPGNGSRARAWEMCGRLRSFFRDLRYRPEA